MADVPQQMAALGSRRCERRFPQNAIYPVRDPERLSPKIGNVVQSDLEEGGLLLLLQGGTLPVALQAPQSSPRTPQPRMALLVALWGPLGVSGASLGAS